MDEGKRRKRTTILDTKGLPCNGAYPAQSTVLLEQLACRTLFPQSFRSDCCVSIFMTVIQVQSVSFATSYQCTSLLSASVVAESKTYTP